KGDEKRIRDRSRAKNGGHQNVAQKPEHAADHGIAADGGDRFKQTHLVPISEPRVRLRHQLPTGATFFAAAAFFCVSGSSDSAARSFFSIFASFTLLVILRPKLSLT